MIECPYCNESNEDSKQYCTSCGKLIRIDVRKELPPIAGTGIYSLLIIITYLIFSVGFISFTKNEMTDYFLRIFLNILNGMLSAIIITLNLIRLEETTLFKFYPQLHQLIIFLGLSQGIINVLLEFVQVEIFSTEFVNILLFSASLTIIYLFSFYLLVLIIGKKVLVKKVENMIKIEEI